MHRSDAELWSYIAATDSTVLVGLKAPGAVRGVWRERVLLTRSEWSNVAAALVAQPGVLLVDSDTILPVLRVKAADAAVLAQIRKLPFVDYVEPAILRVDPAQSFHAAACTSGNTNAWTGDKPTANFTFSGQTYNDVLPDNFPYMHINEAWKHSQGAGITVGSIDTGIDHTQPEITTNFASGGSAGRSLVADWTEPSTGDLSYPWTDDCGHGTHQSSVIAAPLNNNNMVGVAWRANLVSVRHDGDVVNTWEVGDTRDAIHLAVRHGSKVISMAFRAQNSWTNTVADAIRYHYARNVLFVGAAGSNPTCGNTYGTIFPAEMDEVIAVTGIDRRYQLSCGVWYGPLVELAVVVDQAATGAIRLGEADLASNNKSSNATAIVSGIAALVWSRYPTLSNVQVRQRMGYATKPLSAPGTGHGLVSALCAVGVMCGVNIDGNLGPRPEVPTVYRYTALPRGGSGSYAYQWSSGETTSYVDILIYPVDDWGTYIDRTVTVSDLADGQRYTRAFSINPGPYVEGCADCVI